MKTPIIILTSFLFVFLTNTNSIAQNYWLGGFPGQETEWNQPRNWSENRVPDLSQDAIIIPNVSTESGYFPVLKNEVPSIASLEIQSGASLSILKEGKLSIDGIQTFNYGLLLIGDLKNAGFIKIDNTGLSRIEGNIHHLKNEGFVLLGDLKEMEGLALHLYD